MPYIITAAALIAAIIILTSFICFRLTFFSNRRQEIIEEYPLPKGKCYEPYYDIMRRWMTEVNKMPGVPVEIISFDGLKLRGHYYECAPGGPVEIMFPGYRGNAKRDLCGGVQRCAALGHNALIVDQRANGESEGSIITFGNLEYRDCLAWIDFAVEYFGRDVKLILTGISMGASTVMIAAGETLPENVIGVLADCGFTSAKEIICKVMRDIKLPPTLFYPFIKLGARLFGGFRLEEKSAVEALKSAKVPVVFIHGTGDDFVPWEMSRSNFEACVSEKKLVLIDGAAHGTSCMVDTENYLAELKDFWKDKR